MKFLIQGLLAMAILFYLGYLVATAPKTAPPGFDVAGGDPVVSRLVGLQ